MSNASDVQPPLGFTWGELVERHLEDHGGWTALADELVRRARLAGAEPPDLAAVEKGLRRLASRDHGSGGQYGRWLLRHFGVPINVAKRLRWLAQYHSRFSDLPTSIRIEHLRLWDRPPTTESPVAAWVHVGLASAYFRRRDRTIAHERLAAARACAPAAGAFAVAEVSLLAARDAVDRDDRHEARVLLDAVEALLQDSDLEADERLCYFTRLQAQRAFLLNHPEPGTSDDIESARALFSALPEACEIPFVCYRRTAGLAYCAWRSGDIAEGRRLAVLAAEHAGDGGFIRFRIMALNMLSRMLPPPEAAVVRARAQRLARAIEDFHLEDVAGRHRR